MAEMTKERAAQIVKKLRKLENGRSDDAITLFCYFVEQMNLDSMEFAILCEYPIATDVRLVEEEKGAKRPC